VEEARQHPALTVEQRLFATIYHAGSLVLVLSICLQIFRRIDALFPAILVVGSTRIGLAAWQMARPESSSTERTLAGLVINMATWASVMLLLIWGRMHGSGA
jgi:hypothetical protein